MVLYISTLPWATLRAQARNSISFTPTSKCTSHPLREADTRGSLRDLLGSHTTYDLWHVDQTFTSNTPGPTFFWALEIPEVGGDTAFTNLNTAYDALSPAFRETLSSLELHHTSASVGEVLDSAKSAL